MGRDALTFTKIRDLEKADPDRYKFVELCLAGPSLIPVGYMEKVVDNL